MMRVDSTLTWTILIILATVISPANTMRLYAAGIQPVC